MQRYIVANWKCHKSAEEGRQWFNRFASLYKPHSDIQVVVAPSLLSLESLAAHVRHLGLVNVTLAVQDISPFPRGAYTGAIAADMVAGLARYTIVGHSERRRYFHETIMDVANKVAEAIDARLIPIVCVDGSQALAQLGALDDTLSEPMLVAYTPVDALTAKIAEAPAKVAREADHIKQMFSSWPIIYGGSVLPENAGSYFQLPQLSGLFVGAASLDPEVFAEICNQRLPFS
jgi:triosephosphate isomerase (TIM)